MTVGHTTMLRALVKKTLRRRLETAQPLSRYVLPQAPSQTAYLHRRLPVLQILSTSTGDAIWGFFGFGFDKSKVELHTKANGGAMLC